MNIKMLNAHLKLLGPAPKGMKWKMQKQGEKKQIGKAIDVERAFGGGGEYRGDIATATGIVDYTISMYPHMRYWHLVPNV